MCGVGILCEVWVFFCAQIGYFVRGVVILWVVWEFMRGGMLLCAVRIFLCAVRDFVCGVSL